jgi:CubicO group peptidase (beta-lactamase class C family)
MKDTSFVVKRADAGRFATTYFKAPTGLAPMANPQVVSLPFGTITYSPARAFDSKAFPSGGAGMIGSAPDLLRLLEAIRKGGAPVLEESTAGQMFRDHIAGLPGFAPGLGFGLGGGLILDPAAVKSPQTVGTLFWGGVYGHSWFIDPAKKLTVIVFTNTTPEEKSGEFHDRVRDAVYEGL